MRKVNDTLVLDGVDILVAGIDLRRFVNLSTIKLALFTSMTLEWTLLDMLKGILRSWTPQAPSRTLVLEPAEPAFFETRETWAAVFEAIGSVIEGIVFDTPQRGLPSVEHTAEDTLSTQLVVNIDDVEASQLWWHQQCSRCFRMFHTHNRLEVIVRRLSESSCPCRVIQAFSPIPSRTRCFTSMIGHNFIQD